MRCTEFWVRRAPRTFQTLETACGVCLSKNVAGVCVAEQAWEHREKGSELTFLHAGESVRWQRLHEYWWSGGFHARVLRHDQPFVRTVKSIQTHPLRLGPLVVLALYINVPGASTVAVRSSRCFGRRVGIRCAFV
jgi:hypothetical protein